MSKELDEYRLVYDMKKYKKRRVSVFKMKLRIIEKNAIDMLPRLFAVPRVMLFGERIEMLLEEKVEPQYITINFKVSESLPKDCKRDDENYNNENLTPKS